MKRIFYPPFPLRCFLFALLAWGISSLVTGLAQISANLITFTNADGKVIKDAKVISIEKDSLIWMLDIKTTGKIKLSDLPEDIQKRFNYDPDRELNNAVRMGYFRIVNGVVYDIRKPLAGWTTFRNVLSFQQLEDGMLVNLTPDNPLNLQVIHLKNVNILSDKEKFTFTAKLVGNYTYVNKKDDIRTIRSYDAGIACKRDEIPSEIVAGKTAVARLGSGDYRENNTVVQNVDEKVHGIGTGFFITNDGYIVTCEHVVHDANKIKIRSRSGELNATIVKTSAAFDLALLKVDGSYQPLILKFDHQAKLGESIFTIGFPNIEMQGFQPKYTSGNISSLSGIKDDPTAYQISVPVQPGNSGGPLADEQGRIVGVVSSRINDIAALVRSGAIPQNVNYAVKIKYLKDLLETVPEVMNKIKLPNTALRTEGAIPAVTDSTVMILTY